MQEPSQKKTYDQRKENQQGARHGDIPEQKTYFHWCDVLNEENCRETREDNNGYQFNIHLLLNLPTLNDETDAKRIISCCNLIWNYAQNV
jgi:hypothetical protein